MGLAAAALQRMPKNGDSARCLAAPVYGARSAVNGYGLWLRLQSNPAVGCKKKDEAGLELAWHRTLRSRLD